jgi:hypothetical protein
LSQAAKPDSIRRRPCPYITASDPLFEAIRGHVLIGPVYLMCLNCEHDRLWYGSGMVKSSSHDPIRTESESCASSEHAMDRHCTCTRGSTLERYGKESCSTNIFRTKHPFQVQTNGTRRNLLAGPQVRHDIPEVTHSGTLAVGLILQNSRTNQIPQ